MEERNNFYEEFAKGNFCIKFNNWFKVVDFQNELYEYLPNLRDGDAGGYGEVLAKDNDYSNLCWEADTEFHISNNVLYYTGQVFNKTKIIIYDK